MKKSLFALMFTFAFLFLGAVTVNAAEALENNTKVTANGSYSIEETTYYSAKGDRENAKITIAADKVSVLAGATGDTENKNGFFKKVIEFVTTTNKELKPEVAIAKCSTAADGVCNAWTVQKIETKINVLHKGLEVSFAEKNFKETTDTELMTVKLAELTSIYGLENTYFVVVRYTAEAYTAKDTVYAPELYRVVLSDNIAPLTVNSEETLEGTKVTVTSGAPISLAYYFHQAEAAEIINRETFTEKYFAVREANPDNAVEVLSKAEENPQFADGKFTYTFVVSRAAGEHYYAFLGDLAGNEAVHDLNTNTTEVPPTGPVTLPDDFSGTKVGKIILIVLLVILVVALILVIIQKIVDYRRKLY